MVCVGAIKSELGLFVLIALFAFSTGLRTNSNDDLHNQQPKVVSKRDSGFLPMRGRKNDEEFGNSNVEKEPITDQASSNNFDLMKTLNNFLKLNNNGNLEEQLSLIDQTYPTFGQPANNGQPGSLHRAGYEPFVNRRFPLFNSRLYGPNQQITPFLGLMTRYGSPKRAGFVPMRGRKSDPNVLLTNDEDDDFTPYSFKRAGFLPMRGKKSSIDLDELDQYNQKRAFHALRG